MDRDNGLLGKSRDREKGVWMGRSMLPLSGDEDEEDEVKVEFERMGVSHLYSINPSHIISAI